VSALWLAYYSGLRVVRTRESLLALLILPIVVTGLRGLAPSVWNTGWLYGVWILNAMLAAGILYRLNAIDAATGMADLMELSLSEPIVRVWAQLILFLCLLAGQVILSMFTATFI